MLETSEPTVDQLARKLPQGRGFTKYDQIKVGETETTTQYMSENELRFTVPPLPSGLDYSVKLAGGAHGSLEIGTFRIDESKLGVVPTNLEIQSETPPPCSSKLTMRHRPGEWLWM